MWNIRDLSLLGLLVGTFTLCAECTPAEESTSGSESIAPLNLDWNYTPTFTECGGVIPVNIVSNTRIDYKSRQNISDNEFCVWTIPLNDKIKSVNITAQYYLPSRATGLMAYTWNGQGLDSYIFPKDKTKVTVFFNTTVFLTFSSHPFAGFWTGTIITINGQGSLGGKRAEAFHLDEDEGEFIFHPQGVAAKTEFASIVVQGQTNGATQIKEMFLQNLNLPFPGSVVHAYTLYMRHVAPQPFDLIGRFTGMDPDEVSNSLTTTVYPNLYIYTSITGKNNCQSFGIKWRNYSSKNNYAVSHVAC